MSLDLQLVGLPDLSGLSGKHLRIDPHPETVGQLVDYVVDRYGLTAARLLLAENGLLDYTIQVIVNGKALSRESGLEAQRLSKGDRVILMLMAAGG